MSRMLSIVAATTVALTTLESGAADSVFGSDRSRMWVDRAWEIRYLFFVSEKMDMRIGIEVSREQNAIREVPGSAKVYLHADELFVPTDVPTTGAKVQVSTVLIGFDRSGRVLTQNQRMDLFKAKRNLLDHLVLTRGLPSERPYILAEWNQGIPGDLSFSPAVCTARDVRRYERDWDRDNGMGNFGCREWTAQLYDRSRPYIDVTTYSYGRERNYIGEFVGWSRFTDPAKPVIGKQGKIWLCLHECPAGEQPGPIGNIKTWTKKHGFPMPERPPRQPLYPNSNYLDDIRESAD